MLDLQVRGTNVIASQLFSIADGVFGKLNLFGVLPGRTHVQKTAFWRNYFYHCEKTRNGYLEKLSNEGRRQYVSRTPSKIFSCSSDVNQSAADNNPDDLSLVPASVTDDSSYVFAPAPNSADTFTTTRSLDDMVVVGRGTDID